MADIICKDEKSDETGDHFHETINEYDEDNEENEFGDDQNEYDEENEENETSYQSGDDQEEFVETISPEQIESDGKLYKDFAMLREKYMSDNPYRGMTITELSFMTSLLCPEAAWRTYGINPFVQILSELLREKFFSHVREINKAENYDKPSQPYVVDMFEYFVKQCEKKKVEYQVLKPYMETYFTYLKSHMDEIKPSFFPTSIQGFLEFWIHIIPGFCRDVLGFDEQQFLTRTDDNQWLIVIGMQIPSPIVFTKEQQDYVSFVKECFSDKKAFWKYMDEFGVSEENCFGISHVSNFADSHQSTRGNLLKRDNMDDDSQSHEVMEMKNIPQEYLDLLRAKVQEKYPYLWVENAPKWKFKPSDMTMKFQKPVKCSIM